MVIFSFTHDHLVCIDGEIFIYSQDLLSKISLKNEIFIVNYPGSYTGIRKSLAIITALEVFNPKLKIFSINLLNNFANLFSHKVFFAEKHIIHYYEKNQKIQLLSILELDNLLNNSEVLGNILNKDNKSIDFSLENIFKNIQFLEKTPWKQEYYDKFSS